MNKIDKDISSPKKNAFNIASDDSEKLIDLSEYWRTITRAKWLIFVVTLCSVAVGAFFASNAEPVYKASAKILADPQQPNANRSEQYIASSLVFLFFETQYEIIKSRNIAQTVVDRLGLVEKYKQSQQQRKATSAGSLTSSIKNISKQLDSLFGKDKEKNVLIRSDSELRIFLASEIQKEIEVVGGKKSKIINISYTSTDPQEAADIINAVSDVYIQFGLSTRLSEVKNTESWLGEQFSQLERKLHESELKLSDYRSQQGLVDSNQQQNIVNTQLQSLNGELIRAQTNLSAAEEQYLAVKNVIKGSKDFYSLGPVQQNKTASEMVREEADLLKRVNELNQRYGEKHPKMISARSELKSAQANLEREVSKVIDNIEKNYRLAQFQVTNISKLIAETQNNIQSIQTENFSLIGLEREVENNRRIYENFQISLMETSGQSEYTASNINIIDPATVPQIPFSPNIKLIVALSAIFGVFLGVTLAFFRAAIDLTFKTPDMLEQQLKIPALGIIPIVKNNKRLGKPEEQYLDNAMTPFSESINNIRTGLLFSNIVNPPRTILITSSVSGEGKSTTAINLAAAYGNLGNTLLIDVDLRKPSIARSLEIDAVYGLTDFITGAVSSVNDIIYRTDGKELSVITCGTPTISPLELLSSKKFEDMLTLLKDRFDYIILDSPPTLPVSDACVLANKVDGVVLLVKSEDTKFRDAKAAKARLLKFNANILGAVLTVVAPKRIKSHGNQFYANEYYGEKPSNMKN